MVAVEAKGGHVPQALGSRQFSTAPNSFPVGATKKRESDSTIRLSWTSTRLQEMLSRKSGSTAHRGIQLSPVKASGAHHCAIASETARGALENTGRASADLAHGDGEEANFPLSIVSKESSSHQPPLHWRKRCAPSPSTKEDVFKIEAAVEGDVSVTLTVTDDSAPLRLTLCPAVQEESSDAGQQGSSRGCNGAQLHSVLSSVDGGKMNGHLQVRTTVLYTVSYRTSTGMDWT